MMKCEFSYIEQGDPVSLEDLSNNSGEIGNCGYKQYVDNCFAGLLQVVLFKALICRDNLNL